MDVFLETTAIADLLFKNKVTAKKIRDISASYTIKYSSQYVRMEIKRGVLRNFVLIHNKAVECSKLSEVHTYIHSLAATPMRHTLSTMLEAIANFYAEFEGRELSRLPQDQRPTEFQKIMLAAYLRLRIKRFWLAFEKVVDVLVDEVECYKRVYMLKPPTYDGRVFDNTFSNCDRFKPEICRLREFSNENHDGLVAIQAALISAQAQDSETEKRLRAIKQVLRVKKRDVSQRDCWWMGDAILILEAPENTEILNGNAKHYEPMCKAVGKVSVSY